MTTITKQTIDGRLADLERTTSVFEVVTALAKVRGTKHIGALAEIGVNLLAAAESEIAAEIEGGAIDDADVLLNVARDDADAVLAAIEALSPGLTHYIIEGEKQAA